MYWLPMTARSMEDSFNTCFNNPQISYIKDCFIKYNPLDFSNTIINVCGSCIDTPTCTNFERIIHNSSKAWHHDFSGFIPSKTLCHPSRSIVTKYYKFKWIIHYTYLSHNISPIEFSSNKHHKHSSNINDMLRENIHFHSYPHFSWRHKILISWSNLKLLPI